MTDLTVTLTPCIGEIKLCHLSDMANGTRYYVMVGQHKIGELMVFDKAPLVRFYGHDGKELMATDYESITAFAQSLQRL